MNAATRLMELPTPTLDLVAPLFADQTIHLSIAAVLAGAAEGTVLSAPGLAVLEGPEGCYIGRSAGSAAARGAIEEIVPPWAYVYAPPQEQGSVSSLARVFPFMVRHPRLCLTLDLSLWTPPPTRSEDGFVTDVMSEGATIRRDDEVVAWCRPDVVLHERAEIGVGISPAFRRQGHGKRAVAAYLQYLQKEGIETVGWHCHLSNRGSRRLAESLGFVPQHQYCAFSASLPAENADDLEAPDLEIVGHHFADAAATVTWLNFHAAAAYTQAGRADLALTCLERLIAGNWLGEASWLTGHWALAPLASEPRFQACVIDQAERRKGPAV